MDATSSGTLQSQSQSTPSEDSKTTNSSKTGATVDKDRDLTRDNAASPIDLECHIQAERITKILDEAIYKTRLSLCLPLLVQEYNLLNNLLTRQHMDDLVFIFEQYDNPLFSTSLLNMAAMEDIKAGDVSLKNRLNPELGHLLYILNSYPVLKPKVEEMIAHIKEDYIKEGLAKGHEREVNTSLEYLLTLEQFRQLMVVQMATTAAEELTAKLHTRKLEASNERLIQKINEYTECIRVENEQFVKTMSAKADAIAKLEQELAFLNHAASIKLKKKVLDSDRQMVMAYRAHAVKNEMLKEEEVETREGYENLLRMHLIEEKNQRMRRFKVETQLLSWLQKYDTEMTDKQIELDDYEQKYKDEKAKSEELEIKLAEQDKEYIPLMAEREEEYHQEMSEKLRVFQLEHAARVLQVAWRDVLANRAEKKKLKKILVKIKAAKELQEKREAAAQKAAELAAKKAAKAAKKKK